MPRIELKYGNTQIPFEYDEGKFEILGRSEYSQPLSDAEIGEKLGNPIDSKPLEEIVSPGETVLIVVPDATRQTASGQIVNLIIRRLIANGTTPSEINIIFATGIHRHVTEAEKQEILTSFIARRINTLDHGPQDPLKIFRVGETSSGIPIELNWVLTEFDHVILVGGVAFHYFAGFTGGRKLICPGLASARTISETHKLAFDCEKKDRREGVGTGLLDGNTVHEVFMEAVAKINPAFAINTIVNDAGEAVDLYCGNWITSHRKACEVYAAAHTIQISEKRDLVIVSCGGYPHDINMIQAHKALEAASHACNEGGTIILLAECSDGLGRNDFLKWFEAESSEKLAERLCENYQVNGQTAWSLLRKAERLSIRIVTALNEEETRKMRLSKSGTLEQSFARKQDVHKGYILPFGQKFYFSVNG